MRETYTGGLAPGEGCQSLVVPGLVCTFCRPDQKPQELVVPKKPPAGDQAAYRRR